MTDHIGNVNKKADSTPPPHERATPTREERVDKTFVDNGHTIRFIYRNNRDEIIDSRYAIVEDIKEFVASERQKCTEEIRKEVQAYLPTLGEQEANSNAGKAEACNWVYQTVSGILKHIDALKERSS